MLLSLHIAALWGHGEYRLFLGAAIVADMFPSVVAVVIGGASGVVGAIVAAHLRFKEVRRTFDFKVREIHTLVESQQQANAASREGIARRRYVSPLRSAAINLIDRLEHVCAKLQSPHEATEMMRWFQHVKRMCEDRRGGVDDTFAVWCHYEGIYAMMTLYYAAVYMRRAGEVLMRDPVRDLNAPFATRLERHVRAAREALAAADGIWMETQDVLAQVMTAGEEEVDYVTFCRLIGGGADNGAHAPYLRLIDFFRENVCDRVAQLQEIGASLRELVRVIEDASHLHSAGCEGV